MTTTMTLSPTATASKIAGWPNPARDQHNDSSQTTTFETESLMSTLAPLTDLDELDPDEGPPDEPTVRSIAARCADGNGTMTGLFFSDHVADIARAKAMCGLCPLSVECLAGALEREEPWGVWGGELLSGGRVIADKRPCGRPPKNPRPEVVYDEMGPVGAVLTVA